jgi:hypothetical protein
VEFSPIFVTTMLLRPEQVGKARSTSKITKTCWKGVPARDTVILPVPSGALTACLHLTFTISCLPNSKFCEKAEASTLNQSGKTSVLATFEILKPHLKSQNASHRASSWRGLTNIHHPSRGRQRFLQIRKSRSR